VRAVSRLTIAAWAVCRPSRLTLSLADWPFSLTSERAVGSRFANAVAAVIQVGLYNSRYGTGSRNKLEVALILCVLFLFVCSSAASTAVWFACV